MQNHAPNTAVTVTAQLAAEDGTILIPTGIRWRVLDEADLVLQDWTAASIANPSNPTIAVVVLAGLNALAVGSTRGMRRVDFEVTTADSVSIQSQLYLLQASTALTFGVNSFLTLSQAQLLAMDFAPSYLMPWLSALTDDDREQALIQAYARVTKLPLKTTYEDDQTRILVTPWGRLNFEDMTPEQIAEVDPRMMKSLRRAQLIEAAYVLTEDGVNAARKDGLMSMTTGESSQFFRPAKPLELGVCKDAYRELARWIDRRNVIGRG